MRLPSWLFRIAALLVSGLTGLAIGDACVIVDPPGDLPQLPPLRPTIVHGSVVPPASGVIASWPPNDVFIVPVELADPTAAFQWAAFVDYNGREGLVDSDTSRFDAQNQKTRGRIRQLEIKIAQPDLDRCHVIEVVVALELDQRFKHLPKDPTIGADSVTWFFNPSGDLSNCPALDAGVDARFDSEAATDGATDGGVQ
jgi:hypothetical protein